MQEFNEGDLVEAVKGEESHRARVLASSAGRLCLPWLGVLDAARNNGFTLTVIEKAAPKLPTEMYTAIRAQVKDRLTRCILFLYGEMWIDGRGASVSRSDIKSFEVVAAPVPVTAKKVLDAIRQRIGSIDSAHDFQAVAATFGVTE